MKKHNYSLYERILDNMKWILRPFLLNGIDRPTKGLENCRDFLSFGRNNYGEFQE